VGGALVQGITDAQRSALEWLRSCVDETTYLAGGVAVALHWQHRQSRDLDLFTPSLDPSTRIEAISAASRETRIMSQAEGTLYLEVAGVPTSWIRYRYPLLAPLESIEGIAIPVASMDDLAAMKLSAIAGRGAARDFWDLHEILTRRNESLASALRAFQQKYSSHDAGHVVKSLVYFADADAAPLPGDLSSDHWRLVKHDFERWVGAL
jgi:hypothetical protein